MLAKPSNPLDVEGSFNFHLDHCELISHLRMEGKYQFTKENTPIDKHTHVLSFEDGSQLRYNDVRKFGRMTIVEKEQVQLTEES